MAKQVFRQPKGWVWWFVSVILALESLKQEDCTEFETGMGYRAPVSKQRRLGRGEQMKKDSKLSLVAVSFHFAFQLMSIHWDRTALLSSVDEAVLANLEETTMCNKSAGTCIVLFA